MPVTSLVSHVRDQLTRLCRVTGADPVMSAQLVADLLGPAGPRPLDAGPAWPSDIADDHTPIEFSVAFHHHGRPTLRILAEAAVADLSRPAELSSALAFLHRQTRRHRLTTTRLDRVLDLFDTDRPQGLFGMWHSLILRRAPEFKVYLNPEIRGVANADGLVAEALGRLGAAPAHRAVRLRGLRPGEVGAADRLTFFALDLHDADSARIKLYVSQHDADLADVARAAAMVPGVDTDAVTGFCRQAAGPGPYAGRPIISSFTYAAGVDRPIGYSVYVPIRSYVSDDGQAHDRVRGLMDRHGFDPAELDRAIAAVTSRRLEEGVGLLAHVSLRLGVPRPGMTVYLSSEAYQVSAPNPQRVPAR
ncbi:tryptophan dimethylallyltransferase family protein [Nucisporomicrobium flavum]|uniref:tryptophan dimethylallyltransferase family protein n=1 Tax=Nucisporomicrobium flavum TaxID=2785915 RepID=UPI0027DCC3EC|nr:tryptophan dimethylallyltransferase family protein [Nucisporomicrobium flavum]